MYLKRLEMKGFKSFADRTDIDFKSGISCVVGPNGSGKSNITDAVRWVLGEQKVKTLRGNQMADVIFAGTKQRKPVGLAEVSLIFNNEDNYFPLDFTEVKVTRRVYRSGETEYLINGTTCRLKEIKELFMDTGIGTDGYSIIGQGRIDSILSQNKDERRQVFEEAAGIVRYRSKKKETERKLESVELNLMRIDDILNELRSRVGPLEQDSIKAKKYLELAGDLKGIEITLFLSGYEATIEKLTDLSTRLEALYLELQQLADEINGADASFASTTERLEQVRERIQDNNHSVLEIISTMKSTESENAVISERVDNINQALLRFEKESAGFAQESERLCVLMAEAEEALKGARTVYEEKQAGLLSDQEALKEAGQKIEEAEKSSSTEKSRIIDIFNKTEKLKGEQNALSRLNQSFDERILVIQEEVDRLTREENDENLRLQTLDEGMAALVSEGEALSQKVHALEQSSLELTKRSTEVISELDKTAHGVSRASTELKLLEELEKNMEGYDHAVKSAMAFASEKQDLKKGCHGVAASLIEIPEKFETAIDVALGRQLQNIVVETENEAKRIIDHLKSNGRGRATFLPLSNLSVQKKPNIPAALASNKGFLGVASQLVSAQSKFQPIADYLLNRVLIAEDYDTAVKIGKSFDLGCRIVTLEGEIISQGGAITGGSMKSKSSGIVSRKRKIAELMEQLELLKQTVLRLENEKQEAVMALEKLQNEKKILLIQCTELERERQSKGQEKSSLEESRKFKGNHLSRIAGEKATLEAEIEANKQRTLQFAEEMSALEKEKSGLEISTQDKAKELETLTASYSELSDRITEMKIHMATLHEQLDYHDRERRRLIEAGKDLDQRKSDAGSEVERMSADKVNMLKTKESLIDTLAEMYNKKEQVEAEGAALRTDLESLEREMSTHMQKRNGLTNRQSELKESAHKLEIQKTRLETETENILNNLSEKYEMTIEEATVHKLDVDLKDATKQVKTLRDAIKALGDVNVSSIEEYAEVSERLGFMDEQHQDLTKAKKSLAEIIGSLDKRMKKQFSETFEEVRGHFKTIFTELFNGGTADLSLEEPDNELETAIEIEAQPPGKKLQSLNLLSGGEKALTAIALVFAIMKIKPAPFCILDEIEAALDDVNVYRFADFVGKFVDRSQFIIITHRKGTMESADVLYGVTMEEFGVSRILSLKLEDAVGITL